MPFTHKWEENGIYIKFFGIVTAKEVIDASLVFYHNPRSDTSNYQIFDFSRAEQGILDEMDIERIAALDVGATHSISSMNIALIPNDKKGKQLLQRYIDVFRSISNLWHLNICPDLDEARKWISIQLLNR